VTPTIAEMLAKKGKPTTAGTSVTARVAVATVVPPATAGMPATAWMPAAYKFLQNFMKKFIKLGELVYKNSQVTSFLYFVLILWS
jgi:hypothetical protein